MPATQSGSSASLSADFIRQFDQAHEQAKTVLAAQKEFLNAVGEINEHWFARVKSEAELATVTADKLTAARSIPDMATLYQDWFGQRMQRCVEDSNHAFADVQKLMQTGARFAQNGKGRD